jgi:L-alanine-DL-glutamate epimerase-like enolase superfamily enzyme
MIISKVEAFPLRIPFKPGNRSESAVWGDKDLPAADTFLVKVTTDEGLEGWGEGFGFRAVSSAKLAIDELIAPLCLGRDAMRIASLMQGIQKALHVFGRSGPLFYALSAVDIALWDIAGKAAGIPLCQMLGGSRADLPCYASLVRYAEPALLGANVRRVIEAGFRSVKLHEIALPAIRAAREADAGLEIMLDVNCPWTLNEARARARDLVEFDLKWLEEPIWPPENYEGLAALRRVCGIPIAAGENASTLLEFDRLMAAGAVDFVQPSVAKMGGVTEMRKVFPIAAVHNVAIMPHAFYDGPGLLAAIHVTAALGEADTMIEWRDFDLEARLYGEALTPKMGRIPVPKGPGLGLEPDIHVIRDFLRP